MQLLLNGHLLYTPQSKMPAGLMILSMGLNRLLFTPLSWFHMVGGAVPHG